MRRAGARYPCTRRSRIRLRFLRDGGHALFIRSDAGEQHQHVVVLVHCPRSVLVPTFCVPGLAAPAIAAAAAGFIAAAFLRLNASAVGAFASCGVAGMLGLPLSKDAAVPAVAAVAPTIIAISPIPKSAITESPYVNRLAGRVAHTLEHRSEIKLRASGFRPSGQHLNTFRSKLRLDEPHQPHTDRLAAVLGRHV